MRRKWRLRLLLVSCIILSSCASTQVLGPDVEVCVVTTLQLDCSTRFSSRVIPLERAAGYYALSPRDFELIVEWVQERK